METYLKVLYFPLIIYSVVKLSRYRLLRLEISISSVDIYLLKNINVIVVTALVGRLIRTDKLGIG